MNSIYDYNDATIFLNDFFYHQKKVDQEFSIRKWASLMGLQTPVVLIDILKKKRPLKSKYLSFLLKGLKLDNAELMYFQTLISRSNAKDEEEKILFDFLLAELKPSHKKHFKSHIVDDDIDLFSHWIYMAIFSMSELKNFEMTKENIVSILREKVDGNLVESALNSLLNHKILEIENGKIKKTFDRLTTRTDVKYKSVGTYFEQVCDLAKKSIGLPLNEREFQCFSLTIDHKNIPVAKEIIRKCRNALSALAETGGDEVYQTNILFFPLTDRNQDSTKCASDSHKVA